MELVATSQPNPPLALYRPRQPQNSALYQLLEAYYEDVKAVWEERFEKKYGFWRGFVDTVVARYLDCGVAEARFRKTQSVMTCGRRKNCSPSPASHTTPLRNKPRLSSYLDFRTCIDRCRPL